MGDRLTDAEIAAHLRRRKELPKRLARPLAWPAAHNGQKRLLFKAQSTDGVHHYALALRLAEDNPLDFSVIIALCPNGPTSKKRFNLRRYNGRSHRHLNKIEGTRLRYDFHIHSATFRYQAGSGPGRMQPDGYAEITSRYSSIDGALDCALLDGNFASDLDAAPTLLDLLPEEDTND